MLAIVVEAPSGAKGPGPPSAAIVLWEWILWERL
jgi:hypothetical protein